MSSDDPRKLAAAIAVLVLAIGLLSYQIVRRGDRPRVAEAGTADPGMMEEDAVPEPAVVAWTAPEDGFTTMLRRNPFLRPASVSGAKSTGAGTGSGVPRSQRPRLGGIRTGPNPMAMIDEQVHTIGESVRGWRITAIERTHVTLERNDGRTIDLVAQ
ncbi:MAG: hypothetical protein DHS20C21_23960 [Gemmatimonadota bacterium]|nr:MAG: hypothetical protein DHS20C21_23960 [Gemmatimonadota bacterium]